MADSKRRGIGLCSCGVKVYSCIERVQFAGFSGFIRLLLCHWSVSIAVPLVFVVLTVISINTVLLQANIETKSSELWMSKGSRAETERQQYTKAFGPFDRVTQVIFTPKNGDNIWTNDCLEEFMQVSEAIERMSVTKNDRKFVLWDICAKMSGNLPCNKVSASDCFSEGGFTADGDSIDPEITAGYVLRPKLAKMTQKDLNNFTFFTVGGGCSNFAYQPLSMKLYVGGLVLSSVTAEEPGRAQHAPQVLRVAALQNTYTIDPAHEQDALLWELEVAAMLNASKAEREHITVHWRTERSIDDVIDEASQKDRVMLLVGYVLMTVYVLVVTIRTNCHDYRLIGLTGLVMVGCSVVLSLVLSQLLGIMFSPLSVQVLPFLAVGIGVDDMLIILSQYEVLRASSPAPSNQIIPTRDAESTHHTTRHRATCNEGCGAVPIRAHSDKELIITATAKAGPSVMLTTVACSIVWLAGAVTSPIPAVYAFCQQCLCCQVLTLVVLLWSVPCLLYLEGLAREVGEVG